MSSPSEPTKEYVENYDIIIRRVFPCYNDILNIIATSMEEYAEKVLVCGCGNGNEIIAIKKKQLNSHITGFDKSDLMIEAARKKTKEYSNIFLYTTPDFEIPDKGPFSGIVSTLVSHFFQTKEEKTRYYRKLGEFANHKSVLIFTDIFITGEKQIDDNNYHLWENHLKIDTESSRVSKDFAILRKNSFPLTLQAFHQYMTDAGFIFQQQIFQYFNLRMYILRKS